MGDIYDFDDLTLQTDPFNPVLVQAVSQANLTNPELIPAISDRVDLIGQKIVDSSLAFLHYLADEQENGYSWDDDLLMHHDMDKLGTNCIRILLPESRPHIVLKMAHLALTLLQ